MTRQGSSLNASGDCAACCPRDCLCLAPEPRGSHGYAGPFMIRRAQGAGCYLLYEKDGSAF